MGSAVDLCNKALNTLNSGNTGAPFNGPVGLAVNAAGDKLYVGNYSDNKLFVIENPSTAPNLIHTLTVGTAGIAGIGISADKSTLYAVPITLNGTISIISTATDLESGTIVMAGGVQANFIWGDFIGTVSASPDPTWTIGGSLSGLGASKSVVLQNNGGDNLTVSADGNFTFDTAITSGTNYAVTIITQPTGQTCSVTNGTGTASANVTNVAVTCVDDSVPVNGQCGNANNVEYNSEPASGDLCAAGTASGVTLQGDRRYAWSCTGSGGGSTSTCYTLAGKANQTPLSITLGGISKVKSGRSILLKTQGGSGTGSISYQVNAAGDAKCAIKTVKKTPVFENIGPLRFLYIDGN